MAFADKQITCRDCSSSFVFTAGEQEFYANKGLMNEPSRCPSCRSARRASQGTLQDNDGYVRYGNFASFGGKTPRQMHPAACASCDQMTEVPFVPRGDRPVYCSSCYSKIKPSTHDGPGATTTAAAPETETPVAEADSTADTATAEGTASVANAELAEDTASVALAEPAEDTASVATAEPSPTEGSSEEATEEPPSAGNE